MTFPACPTCGAELGPWEADRCLRHTKTRAYTIADQAVVVLETEPGPVYLHDIQRGIEREMGRQTYGQSVSSVVGADRRFCWSGKGMYALFRHQRIPYVRTLADTASFILLAAGESLAVAELAFLMKWSGYRFQDVSLESALNREERFMVGWEASTTLSHAGWKASLENADAERRRFEVMQVPIGPSLQAALDQPTREGGFSGLLLWPLPELITRWHERIKQGLADRNHRLEQVR